MRKDSRYETVETIVDLYDLVSHTFIEQNVTKETEIQIKSTEAVIVLEIPVDEGDNQYKICLLYTSPSPRDTR